MSKTISQHHAILVADTAAYETKLTQAGAKTRAVAVQIGTAFDQSANRVGSATSRIASELASVEAGIANKFTAGKLAEAMLGGFGIGSAMTVLDLAITKVGEAWAEADRAADAALKRAAEIDAAMSKLREKRYSFAFDQMTPEEQKADLEKRLANLDRAAAKADETRTAMLASMRVAESMGPLDVTRQGAQIAGVSVQDEDGRTMRRREFADWLVEQADKAQADYIRLQSEREDLLKQVADIAEQTAKKEADAAKKRDAEIIDSAKAAAKAQMDLWRENSKAREAVERSDEDRRRQRKEGEDKFIEELTRAHQDRVRAILERDTNDYQRRGLQLGADRINLFDIPRDQLGFQRPAPVSFAPPTISTNNAGREDVKVQTRALQSIDASLKILVNKEPVLAA